MKKEQFDLLSSFEDIIKESSTKIAELQKVINEELIKTKRAIISTYDNSSDVMYLVQFDTYTLTFHKATKGKLITLFLAWYGDKEKIHLTPSGYDDAVNIVSSINNPTKCEVRDYMEFGYFDDIKKRYDREDWISEEVFNKKFPFIIEKEVWDCVSVIINKYLIS